MNKSVIQFAFHIFKQAIVERKIVIFKILLAIFLIQVANAAVITFIQGFLAAFLTDTNSELIKLSELVPKSVQSLLNVTTDASIERVKLAVYIPLFIVLFGFIRASAGYLYNFSQEEVAQRIGKKHREFMFSAVLKIPYLSSTKRNPGDWMSVIMSDAQFLQTRFSELLTGFVKDGFEIIGGVIVLAFFSVPAALVLVLSALGIAWSMGRAGKRISYFAEAFQRELGVISGTLLDMRFRFRYMKSQHGEHFENAIFGEANDRYLKMMTGSIFIRSLVTPIMEWTGFVVFACLIAAWTHGSLGEDFTPDIAMKFFVGLGILLRPIRQMGEQVAKLAETMGGLKRSQQLYEEVIRASSEGNELKLTQLDDSARSMKPDFQIKKIEIRYNQTLAFSSEDLSLKSGTAIAVVGKSGSGKSTFIKSMGGLIQPSAWEASFGWSHVVGHSSMVSQTPFLFEATLRENLLYALSDDIKSSTTDEMLYGALRVVNLNEFVRNLPNGLESKFNPLAANFSGGQVQRFVIARALLRRRPILVLDEATSAIDGATELELSKILIDTVHETGTILLSVTHRTSWLHLYDEVWFVDSGRIKHKGKHSDLLEIPEYVAFCSLQSDAKDGFN